MAFRLPLGARLVRFPSTDGFSLEGRLTPADPGRGLAPAAVRGVVLCHPHPLHGGSMLTPVILTAEQAFREAGYTTLLFNFRGVGASEGAHGEGRAEVADVAGALAFVREALGGAAAPVSVPVSIAVAGYSFGSHVGARAAAADPGVGFYLGIAPATGHYDYGMLTGFRGRIALIGGTRDQYGSREAFLALAARLPGPSWHRLLEADHFFSDAMPELAAACGDAVAWAAG